MKPVALILIAALAIAACGRKGDPVSPAPQKTAAEELAEETSMD
ncbi:MAG: lipoprotein [Pseudomonadota bacterium]